MSRRWWPTSTTADTTAFVLVGGGGRLPKTSGTPEDGESRQGRAGGREDGRRPGAAPRRRRDRAPSRGRQARRDAPGRGRRPRRRSWWSSLGGGGPGATLDVDDVAPYLGEAGRVPSTSSRTRSRRATSPARSNSGGWSPRRPGPAQPMHPLQVMGTLHSYYRRARRSTTPVRTHRRRGGALDGRVKEYPARKALDQARALQTDGIRKAFDALFDADLDLKGARDPRGRGDRSAGGPPGRPVGPGGAGRSGSRSPRPERSRRR